LNEIDIPCEYISVNLKTKMTERGEDFLKINPKGVVPVLELVTGERLTENVAIQQYLADEFKATPLLPPLGSFKRYRVLEWLNYISTELHKGCGPLFNPTLLEDVKENYFIPALKKKIAWVEEHLSKNQFLMSDQYTLADGYLFVILRWLPALKVDLSAYLNCIRFMEDLKKRKAIQDALRDEGLSE
jgi:glutathione S-transferase